MKRAYSLLLIGLLLSSCLSNSDFVSSHDGQLWLGDSPYTFVGANLWYGSILGSEGCGGDRARLIRELDCLHSLGIDNLRIMAGADGNGNEPWRVSPCLQTAPGVYNDTLLAGLDFLLYEMGKRNMKAVVYLNNAWDWSGGYVFYLQHAGYGITPNLNDDGYQAYINCAKEFAVNKKAQQLFFNHIRFMLGRTNRYSNLAYIDDPTIMAWQIGNEPRAFAPEVYDDFAQWLSQASELIRSLDSKHLISIGSEGLWGCDMDEELHTRITSDPNIDYLTAHIWPMNWSWARPQSLAEDLPQALANTDDYLQKHIVLCRTLHKPLVIEEFGFPRDHFSFSPQSSTTVRDTYISHIMEAVRNNSEIAGFNFWSWSGEVLPEHEAWQIGDPLSGDPPQEQQGLNSVFKTDTTTLKILTQSDK